MRRFYEPAVYYFSWFSFLLISFIVSGLLVFLLSHSWGVLRWETFFGCWSCWEVVSGQVVFWDGIFPAIVGSFMLVLLSVLISVPLGVASGVYIAQYAGRMKVFLEFSVDILAGIPSIVMGLFGFMMILFLRRVLSLPASTGLWLSAICVAILILPYTVRMTQTALESVSEEVRLEGVALGLTRWQSIVHIMLPECSLGILSGIILAVGRAAEDTAVILLTGAVANGGIPLGLGGKFEALPFTIFYHASEYRTSDELSYAFGAALVLLCVSGLIFAGSTILRRRYDKH